MTLSLKMTPHTFKTPAAPMLEAETTLFKNLRVNTQIAFNKVKKTLGFAQTVSERNFHHSEAPEDLQSPIMTKEVNFQQKAKPRKAQLLTNEELEVWTNSAIANILMNLQKNPINAEMRDLYQTTMVKIEGGDRLIGPEEVIEEFEKEAVEVATQVNDRIQELTSEEISSSIKQIEVHLKKARGHTFQLKNKLRKPFIESLLEKAPQIFDWFRK